MIEHPKYGDIAICNNGYTGLILEEIDDVYYGIHLGRLKLGSPWQSKHPKIISNIYNFLNKVNQENNTQYEI